MLLIQYNQTTEPSGGLDALLGCIIFGCVIYALAATIHYLEARHRRIGYQKHIIQAQPDYLVYYGWNLGIKRPEIEKILNKYFPYYQSLSEPLKFRFTRRLENFMSEKIFIIRHHEGFKEMPVLMSAAAIQISFGLKRYMLPFFRYIQIHPEAYFADDSLRILAGHVQGQTITVAWNHFLTNYQYADGINVGLHEMAHALYYQHMIADLMKHRPFVDNFNEVMERCEKNYYTARMNAHQLFTDNAFKDLQEFWAESLEIFFEKPVQMKLFYPDLFQGLCTLLQQDPANKRTPLLQGERKIWQQLPFLNRKIA
ncbi:zinc-dependent peptidase [Aridibaculum aurantiacum]|uniref:zinc-dependent peptidase n=1 Tax=Aridibaculum aurantiacum TaxID=2810307 RepID=UPI001A97C053|nr:zinc-dependent peptidase [Aridibaculum aurantiacum]